MSGSRPRKADLRGADAEVLRILALQSSDPRRVRRALDPSETIAPSLVPHVIPLLAVDATALDAMRALRTVVAHRSGALLDALLDVRLSPVVRRRIARVMSVCGTRDAVDALLQVAGDDHISVRVQGARTLFLIHRRHPDITVDGERVTALILKEIEAGAQDIGLIFTLLALMYPTASIRAAYRSLRGGNAHARGFALDYLHNVLPTEIRLRLNPVVERMGRLR